MKLFTSAIDKQLFAQYNMGNDLESQKVVAKIFNPYGKGTWYLLNSDPNDPDYVWAIVDLLDIEMGSVSRSELESIKVPPFRLPLERDTSFTPINALELYRGLNQGKRYANGGTTGYNADVEIVENKIGKNYLFPKDSNPDTMGIEFARGGNIKSFRKDEAFRLTPYNSIERSIMDRVPNEQEYKLAGNFFIKGQNNSAYIYFLDEFDRDYVKEVEIKPNERIYRYITRNSAIGGMMPLVKINVENGLVYYPIFKDEDVLVGFDKKGQKTEYLNLIEVDESDYYANGGVIGGLTADEAIYLYVKKAIVQKYREKYLKPAGLWNTDKAKEVEKSLIKKGFLNSAGSINEVGKNKANQVDSSIGLMISRGYLSSTNLPSKYKEIVEKFETIDKMERGGKIDDENKEMLKNQSVEIMHHAKELEDVVKKTDGVEPWVIAKVERSATDLSDVTHYLEGESKKMAKGGELYVDLFVERDGMPYEVKEVLERYEDEYGEDITYEALLQMQEDMENVGYTFDYGLDAIPYGLRPIGVEITQLRDYDDDEYANGGMVKWQDVNRGDNALVISENKMGLVIKPYGRKFHLLFPDGSEKTYDASELKFIKDDDEYANGGMMAKGGTIAIEKKGDKKVATIIHDGNVFFVEYYIDNPELKHIKGDDANIYFSVVDNKYSYGKSDKEYIAVTKKLVNAIKNNKVAYYEEGGKMASGGKVKFADKVKSIKKSLLERKKVSPKVQKDYGKTYSPKEAEESAKRIVGSITAREKMKSKMKK